MPLTGRELIVEIGSDLGPGTSVKELLRHVARKTGIGFRSLERCWKGQYESKTTILKLRERATDNAHNVASILDSAHAKAAQLESCPVDLVDEIRRLADRIRRLQAGKDGA